MAPPACSNIDGNGLAACLPACLGPILLDVACGVLRPPPPHQLLVDYSFGTLELLYKSLEALATVTKYRVTGGFRKAFVNIKGCFISWSAW